MSLIRISKMSILVVALIISILAPTSSSFLLQQSKWQNVRSRGSNCPSLLSSSELHTAYEYIARQRGSPSIECIQWIDPSENITPTPPKRQMGFDIDAISTSTDNPTTEKNERNEDHRLRLPIYPVSAVHLPSGATHVLHNTQSKNIKMAQDLEANEWAVDVDDQGIICDVCNNNTDNSVDTMKRQCFVLTLFAQDSYRLANVGTLVEVTSMEETRSNYDQSILRIIVNCRSMGTVKIEGFEKEGVNSQDDYLIGRVKLIENVSIVKNNDVTADDKNTNHSNGSDQQDINLIRNIVDDYTAVRGMYIENDAIASRELPPWARDAVQDKMPAYTVEDLSSVSDFWNTADSWQMLCNTVRVARRSELQTEMNEIMVEAASQQKGPLKLPIKREGLPDQIQALLIRMEQETSEDFISCGMDSCLDFQVLMGMADIYKDDGKKIHHERLKFFWKMIRREKERLEAKQRLKNMFESKVNSTSFADNGRDTHGSEDSFA